MTELETTLGYQKTSDGLFAAFLSQTKTTILHLGKISKLWRGIAVLGLTGLITNALAEDSNDRIVYGGYVGWIHSEVLKRAIAQVRRDFT